MTKTLLLTALTAALALAAQETLAATPDGYTLEKTVILSRHGIRAPIAKYTRTLTESTPHTWPAWKTEDGELTAHGGELEARIARYIRHRLDDDGLTARDACPKQDEVLIYTNSLQRTIDTGKHFAEGAFPGCDISVHHLEAAGKADDTFNAVIRSVVDDAFIARAEQSVDQMLGEGGLANINTRLADNYRILEELLDYRHSAACEKTESCNFGADKNKLTFTQHKKPAVSGPLQRGGNIVSSFILQYYENYPEADVAWGGLKTPDTWRAVMDIKNTSLQVLYTSPVIAKETAAPLLAFIQNSFTDHGYTHPLIKDAQNAKTVLLVGHNSNIASLLALLNVEPYRLDGQYEQTPVSGKVLFERWRDKDGKAYIKIEYLYQSAQQLRENSVLDEQHPAQRTPLKLADCPIYCPIDTFDRIATDALKP